MPHIPDFPSPSGDDEKDSEDRHRGGIIDRIIDDGFPTAVPTPVPVPVPAPAPAPAPEPEREPR
ncbi:hypothetical protein CHINAEXTREME_08980 [Halobiforma lacisalsi AJ5]|uniref:Uncharacterized protein n=1 Tax=Natronobacterium lacisalsi AJ5 TaxID=358396 RepID=M0L9M6_NATLA|nr:hypothetical protein [Halobiforma lacisalsi]APW97906.1 hypothetical protein CHINAEXTREME_08980 [Halobiforma lacisalsi AJ5]EMA29174.1 hypothetical protein C445_17549 [Halobiforma lacisalsi AJ5]